MSQILVVDDNEQNRLLVRDTLESEGLSVLEAPDGLSAVEGFTQHGPACVLMDVRMPGIDGFETARRIRGLPGGSDVPIIFVTAQRDLETFDAAQRAGADDFLTKPVRPSELLARVKAALKLVQTSTELRETYDLVKKQRDEMMRMQLQKERLMAFVVHDLKNPATAIDMSAQILLSDRALADKSRELAQRIRSDVRAMMRLVLNLLDISRAEEGQLVPRKAPVSIIELVAEVADAMRVRAGLYGVNIVADVQPIQLKAERELVRRVLENLIENAIRHAPADSAVRVMGQVVPEGRAVELRVADSGPGVPPELRERIFDKFVQVEGHARNNTHTNRGLGLTFCKVVVEAHGGKMSIEDAGPGAVFVARFPHE